ncbi:DUF1320 domain-containing protein [Maritimibacter sp. 55A14]|uniref:gp436 family protein n=1 Tax=Maritimibacter sp. 55A14 TaxID=2174844 RepID=UPI000D61C9E0|nr:DUF1320 domain-containing protein [Maritimibacter sp. 55A14]PWE29968.1 DUF1320 domain-containing protein [Maritimibacter sp. 55A14]
MPYTDLPSLIDRYGERMLRLLTDRAQPPAGLIDQAVVDRALADADAIIDAALMVRYKLPLASVPALVADLAQAIAIWKLHTATPDQKIEADYKDAQKTLDDLSKGLKRLNVAGVEPASSGSSGAQITDRERPFTAKNLKGFI